MDIPQTTPPEAFETLQQHPDAVYLDVRTEGEFEAGHPAGARNIPVLVLDPSDARAAPESGLRRRRRARAAADDEARRRAARRADDRSTRASSSRRPDGRTSPTSAAASAARAMQTGRVVVPGWRDAGLPVESGRGEGPLTRRVETPLFNLTLATALA